MAMNLGIEDSSIRAKDGLKQKKNIWIPDAEYSVTYLVLSDSLSEDVNSILFSSGVPALYQPGLAGTFVQDRDIEVRNRVRHPVSGVTAELYAITVHYKSDVSEDPQDQQSEPDMQRPKLKWSEEFIEVHVEKDLTGKPVQTANQEPLFIADTRPCPLLSITRFERGVFNPLTILSYVNAMNSETFYGAPVGTAMMKSIEADEEYIKGELFNSVTYGILFNMRKKSSGFESFTWDRQILHEGYKYRTVANGAIKVFTEPKGSNSRINLNIDGVALPRNADPSTYVYLRFKVKHEQNFNDLYLGPY